MAQLREEIGGLVAQFLVLHRLSAPSPPTSTSLPSPPRRELLPAPPFMMSAPSPPRKVFARPSPVNLSAAVPPVTFSMFLIASSLTPPTSTAELVAHQRSSSRRDPSKSLPNRKASPVASPPENTPVASLTLTPALDPKSTKGCPLPRPSPPKKSRRGGCSAGRRQSMCRRQCRRSRVSCRFRRHRRSDHCCPALYGELALASPVSAVQRDDHGVAIQIPAERQGNAAR